MFRRILISIALLAFTTPAYAAYYGLLDNGEVLPQGRYKLTGDAQVLTDNGGLNVGGTFDMGMNDEFGLRALLGFGKIDFYAGAMVKWMPIPDVDRQPAMGMNIGLVYGNDGDYSDLSFRFEPMLSKKITIESTVLTPYAAVPVSMRMRNADNDRIDDDTKATFQLVVGSQLQIEQWKNLQFMAEIGIDLDNAPGYIAGAAVFYFDQDGFSLN
jgi:hypothetical protein